MNISLAALWAQLGITILVLAIIAAVAFFAVRFLTPKMGRGASTSRMQIIEKLPLEPRRCLYLVRVDDQEMVVGVTDGSVSVVAQNPAIVPKKLKNGSPEESDDARG